MRTRRLHTINASPADGGIITSASTYQWALFALVCLFVVLVVVVVTVTLTVPSPAYRNDLLRPAPNPGTTASPTLAPTAPTATSAPTEAPTAPPTEAPTSAPTAPPLGITCPPDVTVTLGAPLDPALTGGRPVVTGGCTTPVVQYADSIVGTGMPTQVRSLPKRASSKMTRQEDRSGLATLGVPHFSRSGRMPPLSDEKERCKRDPVAPRSPSFSFSNLYQSAQWQDSLSRQGAVLAVSHDRVVLITRQDTGWLVTVHSKDLSGCLYGIFLMDSLGSGNCSTGHPDVAPQVAWDWVAQRWVMAQYASQNGTLCVYVSTGDDPNGPYHALAYEDVPTTPSIQLAVWGRTYAVVLDESNATASRPLCVLDRESTLAWNETHVEQVSTFNETTNVTTVENVNVPTPLPGLFCGAALNPLTRLTRWTPVHAEREPPPPNSTESSGAGTPGAVFFRAIDDEYQFGETLTPLTDQLEVEHWYNLNWTTATYGAIRYKFSVADFDQRTPSTVPTPTTAVFNVSAGVLMPRMSYRYIPATGQESAVAALTSHANGVDVARVYWFEMRWRTPTTQQTQPIWVLYQQGVTNVTDGTHKYLPSVCMDANGTIALGYSASNNETVYPGTWATTRLGNDPNNTMRDPLVLHEGAVGSVIADGQQWGPWSMACDAADDGARWFYYAGAVSDLGNPRILWLDRLRVLGEIVQRDWRADDTCGNSINCTSYITTI